MKKIWTLVTAAAVAAAILAAPCHAKTVWTANSVWPPENNHSVGLAEFAEKVRTATGGELELAVKSGGVLGYKGPELLRAVRDGRVPVSDILISGVAVDERIFQIVTLPFLARDLGEMKMLVDLCRPAFDRATEGRWGQKILYVAPWPGTGLWTKKRIETAEDMKGLKTRVYDMSGALLMEAAGATPFVLPFGEVHKALQAGFVDSVLTSTPTAVDAKFWELLKYYEPLDIEIALNMVTVNLRAFQGLPRIQQEALVTAGREMEKIMWDRAPGWGKDMETLCRRKGIVTVAPSRQQIEILGKAAEFIRADWLRTAPPEGRKIYADFLEKAGR